MDLLMILCVIALRISGGLSDLDGVEGAEADTPRPLRCKFGFQPCKDGSDCVMNRNFCDGEEDCKDGSDEEDCSQECGTGQFQCAHGRMCIELSEVCDGVAQCQDRSDEADCWKATPTCALRCDNRTRCVPESFLCDGEVDCLDGTDEAPCANETCAAGEFRCLGGQCVPQGRRCDGQDDCPDRSDEAGCAGAPDCPARLRCPQGEVCLLEEWLCDGEVDCGDGSDEKKCKVVPVKCGEFQWACASKTQCVPSTWRCDGVKDCKDHSDETGCDRVKCPSHQYQCVSGACLAHSKVCDGTPECPDGSDEGGACTRSDCANASGSRCAHDCYSTPQGMRCACMAGFELQPDGVSCADVNECDEDVPRVCSHSCNNTQGSYSCHCHPGYLLEPDAHSCKIAGEEPLLLVAVQHELLLLSLRHGRLDVLFSSGKSAILSLDYDWRERTVFWVSRDADSIKWISLDQRRTGTFVKGIKLDCIAVDWVGRNLYWTDGVAGQILAAGLNSTVSDSWSYTVVLDEDLEQPQSLVLLPQRGLMFWAEIGSEPQIERAGLDGSGRTPLVRRKLSWPASLSVDPLADRIYWTDEKLKCVGSATLDGGDIKIIQLTEMASPFSVVVFNDKMYWSDTKSRKVRSAHKNTGKDREVLLKRPGQPFGLKVIHGLLQPNATNPCARLSCSHLCLLAPGSKGVCRCPPGLSLAPDGISCARPANDSFLLLLSPTAVTQISLESVRGEVGLQRWPEHRAVPLGRVTEPRALDLAVSDRALYLSDGSQGTVGVYELRDALGPRGPLLQLQGEAVAALALDWVTRNLYWSGSKRPAVRVTSPDGKRTATLIREGLGGPASIALHPPSGWLCFTNLAPPPRVECAFMDGRNRTVLWKRAAAPTALSFSDQGTRLYWADVGAGVIASVGMDGSGYRELQTGDGSLQTITYADGILFWTTLNGTSKVWFGDGVSSKTLWFQVKTEVIALKAYGKGSQTGTSGCSRENGGCSQLCLPFPGGRTCRCALEHLPNASNQSDEDCVNGSVKTPADRPDGPHPSASAPASDPGASVVATATPEDERITVQNLDSEPCDDALCNGRGACARRNGEAACACQAGYSGEFCQHGPLVTLRNPLAYAAIALVTGLILLGVGLAVRKRRLAKRRARSAAKETSLMDMEKRTEASSTQNGQKDACDPAEECASPAD